MVKGIYELADETRRMTDFFKAYDYDGIALEFEESFALPADYTLLAFAEASDADVQVELRVSTASPVFDSGSPVVCSDIKYAAACRVEGHGGQVVHVGVRYIQSSQLATKMRVQIGMVGPSCNADGECDDGIACTIDRCEVQRNGTKQCVTRPDHEVCDDGSACTHDEACVWGSGCRKSQETCIDSDPCTVDSCSEEGECVFAPLPCPVGQQCSEGVCYDPCDYSPDSACGCANGVQDHGETGIDCGGACAECGAKNCHALLALGYTENGEYLIDPDGPGGEGPILAQCDMITEGGGWTLIAAYPDGTVPKTVHDTALPLLDSAVPGQTSAHVFAKLNGRDILMTRSLPSDARPCAPNPNRINRVIHVEGLNGGGQFLRSGWSWTGRGAPATLATKGSTSDEWWGVYSWTETGWGGVSVPKSECRAYNPGFNPSSFGWTEVLTTLYPKSSAWSGAIWDMNFSRDGSPQAWVRGFNDGAGRVLASSRLVSGEPGIQKAFAFEVPDGASGLVTLVPQVRGNGESVTMSVRHGIMPTDRAYDFRGPLLGDTTQAQQCGGLQPGTHYITLNSDASYVNWHLLMQYDGPPVLMCGNFICQHGEDCNNCSTDCAGSKSHCCGDSVLETRHEGDNGEVCDGNF